VSLRRCGSVTSTPVAKSPTTEKSLVEKKAISKPNDQHTKATQAA